MLRLGALINHAYGRKTILIRVYKLSQNRKHSLPCWISHKEHHKELESIARQGNLKTLPITVGTRHLQSQKGN